MKGIEIELGQSSETVCPHCEGTTKTVWGYVYSNSTFHAVYYARWTVGHENRWFDMAISIGGWSEGANESERQIVALDCRVLEGVPWCMVIDAETSPWGDWELLGRKLSREEALDSSVSKEAFQLYDELIWQDTRLRNFILFGRCWTVRKLPSKGKSK